MTHINPDVCAPASLPVDVSHRNCQIMLLGDADNIIEYLCDGLGWTLPPAKAGQYLSGQFPTLMKRRSQEYISPGPKRVADRYVDLRSRLR